MNACFFPSIPPSTAVPGPGSRSRPRLSRELGGSIRAESNSAEGARFLIRLPLLGSSRADLSRSEWQGHLHSLRRAHESCPRSRRSRRVIRTSLEEILTEEGYGVATAATAAEALLLVEDASYDVVLPGHLASGSDGLDVLAVMDPLQARKSVRKSSSSPGTARSKCSQSYETRGLRLSGKATLARAHADRPANAVEALRLRSENLGLKRQFSVGAVLTGESCSGEGASPGKYAQWRQPTVVR